MPKEKKKASSKMEPSWRVALPVDPNANGNRAERRAAAKAEKKNKRS